MTKKYIERRTLLQESLSWGSAIQTIVKLQEFFKYIHIKYPNWKNLTLLNRSDIEDFLQYLGTTPMGGNSVHKGKSPSSNHINRSLSVLETFIEYSCMANFKR